MKAERRGVEGERGAGRWYWSISGSSPAIKGFRGSRENLSPLMGKEPLNMGEPHEFGGGDEPERPIGRPGRSEASSPRKGAPESHYRAGGLLRAGPRTTAPTARSRLRRPRRSLALRTDTLRAEANRGLSRPNQREARRPRAKISNKDCAEQLGWDHSVPLTGSNVFFLERPEGPATLTSEGFFGYCATSARKVELSTENGQLHALGREGYRTARPS